MKSKLTSALLAAGLLINASAFADDAASGWSLFDRTNTRFILGTGGYDFDFDPVTLDGRAVEADDNGFGFTIGILKSIRPNVDIEWSLVFANASGNSYGTSVCNSDEGTINCDLESSTNIISMPVIANYNHALNQDFSLHAGLGGAINHVRRSLEYTASGFESSEVDDLSSTTVSPYGQIGLTYKRFRFNYLMNIGASDDKTGKGDINAITVSYLF